MATVHRLSRRDAQRVAVRAQLLEAGRPADLVKVVQRLTLLQLDPTSAIAPSADLVAWSRLGPAYSPDDLRAALVDRRLVELHAYVRPAADIALYRARMAAWPGSGELRDWQVHFRDGSRPTTAAAATSWRASAKPGHCRPASCPTAASDRGDPPAGPTTRT
jgi:uncharacterized protein